MKEYKTRKQFLQSTLNACSALLGLNLVACSRGESDHEQTAEESGRDEAATWRSCDDTEGVPPDELEKREVYGYVEKSTYPDMLCSNCSLYIPPSEVGGCGGCVLFEGPVFAEGYCDYWAPEA